MTDDFDDDLLRDALRARSGGPVPTAPGRATVLSRAARSRTRRTLAVGGSTTAVLIAGLILLSGTVDSQLEPAQPPSSSATSTIDEEPQPTSTVPPEPSTTLERSVSTTMPADDAPDDSSAVAPSPSTAPAAPTPPTTSSTAVPAAPTAPTADAPFTRRFDTLGGSITVRWDGNALDLLSVSPLDGFVSEIEDDTAQRIRVRFRGDDDARIEVRADDGTVTSTIS